MLVSLGRWITASRRAVLLATTAGLATSVAGRLLRAGALRETGAQPHSSPDAPITRIVPVRTGTRSLTGARLPQSVALYTPLWSDADAVYIADSIPEQQWWTVAGRHPRARFGVWRLPKNGATPSFTEVDSGAGGWEFDESNAGHRGAGVTVTDSGRVLVQPPLHKLQSPGTAGWSNAPLAVSVSRDPHDISAFSPLPAPAGARMGVSYSRFFRDPYGKTSYLLLRGSDYQALLFTWDDERQLFRPLHREDTRYDPSQPDGYGVRDGLNVHPPTGLRTGAYGHELAFSRAAGASTTTLWCAAEFRVNSGSEQSGFPRRDIGLARSDDGGRTWRHPRSGVAAAQLFTPGLVGPAESNILIVFEGPVVTAGMTDDARHDSVGARVAVTAGGRVVVVAAWARRPAGEQDAGLAAGTPIAADYRSLWAAVWDPATSTLERTCLYHPGSRRADGSWGSTHHTGLPTLASSLSGTVVVVASTHDDHDHAAGRENWDLISEDGKPTSFETEARLHVYSTTDGSSWTDSPVSSPLGSSAVSTGVSGAYVDPQCLDLDGLLRVYPVFPREPTRAELWELPVPGRSLTPLSRRLDRPTLVARPLADGIAVTWAPPPSDAGSAITQYVVHSADGTRANSASPALTATGAAGRGIADRTAAPGVQRSYVVFARTSAGASLASATATATSGAVREVAPPSGPPTFWYRASDLPLVEGARIASAPPATGAVSPVPAVQPDSARQPRFLSDGPGGLPAIRFDRGEQSRLLLPSPPRFSGVSTVLLVARVRDHDWSHLLAAADADGVLVPRAPFSRTCHSAHETRSAGADTDGTQGLAVADASREIVHRVESAAGVGAWKVYVSQWRVDPWSKLRVSGQINRCGSSQIELPATDAAVLTAADEPASAQTCIGSVTARSGDVLTSSADIAEILRFDGPMTRARLQDWVLYLLARHRLPSSNVVESELRRRWDRGTPPDCIDVVRTEAAMVAGSTAGALPHDSCSRLLPTGTYQPSEGTTRA
ncbi:MULTISPECIES: hypothetical protein [unclassified Rathayibacter]|uniref:hypothetical protein n=1 Tax=unclassified Rathayibacter TaxID=2609250 RepID=UPI00188C3D72|nr:MULTISPECIES: hypothetical protein [unclassified Rathayibacter]MBF4462760.1 hypothetical protein [Rathayibacter sp. VKM Ac-2879]MBF4504174.1 hypothetical protein [Rathayibacter sp. VKM Ac-2878]